MYVVYGSMGGGWQVLRVDEARAHAVAGALDEATADRIAHLLTHEQRINQLLERHGLVDVPLEQVEQQ